MKKIYAYLLVAVLSAIFATSADAASISLDEKISGTATQNQWITYDITIPELGFLTIDFEGAQNKMYPEFELYGKQLYLFIDRGTIGIDGRSVTYGVKAGTYKLRISTLEHIPSAPFSFTARFTAGHTYDVEPNDKISSQLPEIPANTTIKGTTNLGPGVDYFKITSPKDQYLHVSGTKTSLAVYSDDNKLVCYGHYGNLTVPIKSGTYYIEAHGDNYEFTYSFTDAPKNSEFEYNNTIETATPLPLNKQIIASANFSSDEDMFAFSVPKLGFAKIDLQKDSQTEYNFYVYNKSGKKLFKFSSAKSFQMGLEPDNYYLKVEPGSDNEKYALTLSFEENAYPNIEDNNSIETAQLLPFNTPLRAISPGRLGNDNVYKLNVEKAGYQEVHIDLDAPANAFITVYDANGYQIGRWNRGEVKSEQTYSIGLGKGTYYVEISTFESNPYTIQVTTKSDYAEQEQNDTRSNASPVHFNNMMYGYFDQRHDVDYYTFTIDKTKTISWVMDPLQVSTMNIQILDSFNKVIWEGRRFKQSGEKELKKGTYYVKATAMSDGEYTLLFNGGLSNNFKDVPKTHTYYQEIMNIRRAGIITGYEDNTFKPTNPMQRQHVAAMIARANAPSIPTMLNPYAFPDVPITHPNYTNIQKLVSGGIIDENPNGFNPNGTITRAQMAKILVKAYELEPKRNFPITFKDVSKTDWYYEYVQILAQYGITTGENGYFKPNQPLSRQHFSVFLARTITQ
ncbi:S-layer homology domain-containing protein [Lysinibacillus sp. BPa_S21]|uniref:S-layer homology domain-containing protein n=1 Tax=Lysinibacillus sp. BPa_S21 TaxID=2932478 RepID=UPI0020132878|nr:S-layer homology domain-containing protein [Lysinibacillus sp. BPa_S21]MCL1696772.1 S-layer homology domain-containing protein [Lysinibacillus sp. BPa_S21]